MFWNKKPEVIMDGELINETLSRGVDEIIGKEDLEKDMRAGKRLRIKLGIDPTSPNLHLGRSVPLLKMRDFQQLGHTAVLIVGDFTGVIGDTSDKESERPMLSRGEIEKNKKKYFEQIGTLVDLSTAELRYNSEWLEGLTYREIGEHADQFSVADFIGRDNIKRRLDSGKRVSLREMLYPMMQGYDSVAIKADVELGGVDQRFNLLAGRTLQSHFGQKPQNIVVTTFPVEGLDGRKMSSSWGNTVNFNDTPEDMYGKIMRTKDELIGKYLTVLTRVPTKDIQRVLKETEDGKNPRDGKMYLAKEIVRIYHGESAAQEAEKTFINTFQKGEVPNDISTLPGRVGDIVGDIILSSGAVSSKTEWRRLVLDGAVKDTLTGEAFQDPNDTVTKTVTLKIGKRRFVKIELI